VKHLPKVFVVDDDPAVLKSLEAVLSEQGYAVSCFTSAREFMAQHHPIEVGCILVDLMMPGVSGSDLLRWLQESGSLLSVVITSGLLDSTDGLQPDKPHVQLLEKPYEVSMLLTMVEDGIAGSLRRRAGRGRSGPLK
jgi:FixJ family two-component response regulator